MMLPPIVSHSDTIVVAAPGPSLTREQIQIVREHKLFTIAIGEVGRLWMSDANILYHADAKWWNYYNGVPSFQGYRACMEKPESPQVFNTPRSPLTTGLDMNYPYLVTGSNSGYQAINLAAQLRPTKIILIGYDMKDSCDGRHNIDGDHPKPIKRPPAFELFRQNIGELCKPLEELNIVVYNSTIDTALKCFPKKELLHAIG